ncbi:MAG: DUF885 domain-containing protein [Ginsengibacter sp.]
MINLSKIIRIVIIILAILPVSAKTQTAVNDTVWISKSNSYTMMLLDIDKKYSPEFGSSQGLAECDTLISIPTLTNIIVQRKEKQAAISLLKSAKQTEKNPAVRQDLDILINNVQLDFRRQDFQLYKKVSFLNATSTIFEGLQILLDDQTPVERRSAAIVRLRKYAGLIKGNQPLTAILQDRTQKQLYAPNMIYPSRQQMEVELSRNASMVSGIEELFKKYQQAGWEHAYATIKKQLESYDAWIRANLLPRAHTDFRLTPDEYKLALEIYGVDIDPADLAKMAHAAFTDFQNQMKPLAEDIAKKYNLPSNDYREVIKFLKNKQIIGDSIIPLYESHLRDIEDIIRKQQLITLPNRPAIIRLSTAAETAQQPAPHMVPPPFLNNTGQRGVFVLPLNMPAAPGETAIDKYDDFTFDAASWTIIAHEARPGHELQFDKMVEEGVSQARALYAFNSTNVEGWALYSEYITRPYMPVEGQLISLDYRLLRAARAFLDPELQSGKTTQQQALELLMKDVVQSHAFAKQEVERYALHAPGQANSYFYGYTKMLALRKDAEKALGTKFNQLRFHDFILSQGILPPALIRQAVMNDFIPKEKS